LIRDRYLVPTLYQVGVGIGIVSISIFFVALIVAYSFRMEADRTWQRFTAPSLLWLSTALLAVSSLAFESGRRALRHAVVPAYRKRTLITLAFGLAFLIAQVAAARQLLDQGVGTSNDPHLSAYYMFMGLHGLHLAAGLTWLAVLYVRSRRLLAGTESDIRQHRRVAQAAAMYWHFMGALWVVLFCFLLWWTRG
jgi:cytochrome c oxidase subunit III